MSSEIKRSILLVEDELLIALSVKQELENYNYIVYHALNGEEAVKVIIENIYPIELILMDIDLGSDINGTQAAENILSYKEIPIVFVSSHTEKDIVEKTEKITSYGYVVKNAGIIVLDASIKMAFKLFDSWRMKKESEEKYRFLVENIKDVIWIMDAKTMRFTFISPSVKQLRGYTPEEIMSETVDASMTPENTEYVYNQIEKQLSSIESSGELDSNRIFYTNNIEQPCKDGSIVLTEVVTRFYRNEKTGHIDIHGVSRDISGRK